MILTKFTGASFLAAFALGACGATPAQQQHASVKPQELEIPVSKFPGDIPPGTPLPIPEGMQHLSFEKVVNLLRVQGFTAPSPNGQTNWEFDHINHRILVYQTGGPAPYSDVWPYAIENDGRVCLKKVDSALECFYIASIYKEPNYYIIWYSKHADTNFVDTRYKPITIIK
jgi:hypothetical protein